MSCNVEKDRHAVVLEQFEPWLTGVAGAEVLSGRL
jgi:hypothetical protein